MIGGALTGGLVLLPCGCPCDLIHPENPGICEKTPVVATLQAAADLETVSLLLCVACARAAGQKKLPLIDSV